MSPRAELAAALRAVNRLHAECPEPRPDVFTSLTTAEAEVDAAVRAGDERSAHEVVEAWRDEAMRVLSSRLIHAPLTQAGEVAS